MQSGHSFRFGEATLAARAEIQDTANALVKLTLHGVLFALRGLDWQMGIFTPVSDPVELNLLYLTEGFRVH